MYVGFKLKVGHYTLWVFKIFQMIVVPNLTNILNIAIFS